MDALSNADVLKELHGDLARKYKMHAAAIENMWRSFNRNQRVRCMKAGAADGVVLEHSLDRSMGNVYKLIPEFNLRDITEPGSDSLLSLLKHRATKTLFEQYCDGVNGGPGDHAFIDEMIRRKGLRHVEPFKDCYTAFMDDEKYGESYKILSDHDETLASLTPAIRARVFIPQSTGELILQRQMTLLQSLNIIIDDILDEGSQSRNQEKPPKKPDKAASASLSKLTIQAPPANLSLPDLVACARDQKAILEEYLGLLSIEPLVLAHAVNVWFFTRPEFVADEKGRVLPVHTDKYISAAFFDVIHSAIKGLAIWNYIGRLLELLESLATDKVCRAIGLQEISNICHLEYSRTQALFKRHVQASSGSKWFKRVSNVYDNAGNPRVTMKGNPENLTRTNPQLHYMLRLCQPETSAFKAVDWMMKLSDLHKAHPMEREKIDEKEAESLCDLAVIVGFIQDLSSLIPMPSFSRKKGRVFVSKLQELEVELNQLKEQIDLRDFVVPINNLLEPGMAENALKTLDQFIVEKAGTKMGFLYQDLVEDCFSDLQNHCQQAKTKIEHEVKTELSPLPVLTPQLVEKRVEQRKQKEKTRPFHSSTYEIVPHEETHGTEEPAPPPNTFKVDSSTAEVFSKLFTKSQSRGSVSWTAFEAAMVGLGFSVLPKFGSVYTFLPPDTMAAKKSFTAHRPHKSRIEGYVIPIFARRLKRLYGWGEQTFEVA
jgi:hypothetical protein